MAPSPLPPIRYQRLLHLLESRHLFPDKTSAPFAPSSFSSMSEPSRVSAPLVPFLPPTSGLPSPSRSLNVSTFLSLNNHLKIQYLQFHKVCLFLLKPFHQYYYPRLSQNHQTDTLYLTYSLCYHRR